MTGRKVDLGSVVLEAGSSSGQRQENKKRARSKKGGRRGHPELGAWSTDVEHVASTVATHKGRDIDVGKVALAMSKIDTQVLAEEAKARVEWEIWDRESPINGVPAERILARPEYASCDEVYLVRVDEKVVFFQPYVPHVEGMQPMTEASVESVAAAHCEELATAMASEALILEVSRSPIHLPAESAPENRRFR